MKKNCTVAFIIAALLFVVQTISAQTDTIPKDTLPKNENDSLNAAILKDYNKKIKEIEQYRIADSLKRAKLEAQITALKTTDNLKKEDLEKQLQALREAEANRFVEKKRQIDSLRHTAKAYPVLGFFDDTLLLIYNKSGSFSAKERAKAVSGRIKELADNVKFKNDSLRVVESESTFDIVAGTFIVMSISENDAIWNNTTKRELAGHYQQIITQAIKKYKSETSFGTLLKEIGLALLVLLLIVVIIYYIGKFFKWLSLIVHEQEGKLIKGIKFKNYTLFDAPSQVRAITNINRVIKWIFILLAIYITLPVLFGIFPWTQNFADTLFGYILDPLKAMALGFWNYLPKLITIVVILFVFRYILRAIHFLKVEIERGNLNVPGFYADWANPTFQIIRVLIFAFMIVVIFPYLPGSDSPVFKGVSVFLGFLFTFGSAGSLSNLISGLVLTYMRLFKLGDRVKIGEVVGDVIEKSPLVTRVRTIKNEIVSIPNSTVMNSHTVNYSSDAPDKGLIINTTVTIGYDSPWRDVHQALIEAAQRTEWVLKEPAPFVLQTGLNDFYVSYQVNAYIKEPNKQAVIYSDLHQHIQDVFNEKGIEILSPHYRAARDGNATSIPASYLPENYEAPAFNIRVNKEDDNKAKNI
ncbi:MAG TPA: mechanosensitive ion channel domain-containing protein [Agriterribacter sp.]|nr:mechanosensitive ion channel domain-containing protein [Agriterribacter sp.]